MLLRKQIIIVGLLSLLVGFSNRCLAQESSLRFISGLTDSLLELTATQFSGAKASQVVIKRLQETDSNWFFEGQLIEFLKRQSISHIYLAEHAEGVPDASALVLEYELLKLNIGYDNQFENNNRIKRAAEVSFFLRVVQQGTGNIVLSEKFEARKTEWLHANQALSTPGQNLQVNIDQTRPKKSSLVQPVLISGITGIIVYMFYALRSR